MEPFTLASKLVTELQKVETRHLGQPKLEPVFEQLTEKMSDVLEWYEEYEKASSPKITSD